MKQFAGAHELLSEVVLDGMSYDFQEGIDMIERDKKPNSIYQSAVKLHSDRILEDLHKILSESIRDRLTLISDIGLKPASLSPKEISIEMSTLFQIALNRSIFQES